jgi:Domain of unknown function (DUF6285)
MEVSMIDSVIAADLLDECHTVLTRELIALLPADRRYEARMIASAVARVSRQIKVSRRTAATEIEAIEHLAGNGQGASQTTRNIPPEPDRVLETQLATARARLCDDVRAGQLDARLDNPGDLLWLREIVHAKLQVTNPKLIAEAS